MARVLSSLSPVASRTIELPRSGAPGVGAETRSRPPVARVSLSGNRSVGRSLSRFSLCPRSPLDSTPPRIRTTRASRRARIATTFLRSFVHFATTSACRSKEEEGEGERGRERLGSGPIFARLRAHPAGYSGGCARLTFNPGRGRAGRGRTWRAASR